MRRVLPPLPAFRARHEASFPCLAPLPVILVSASLDGDRRRYEPSSSPFRPIPSPQKLLGGDEVCAIWPQGRDRWVAEITLEGGAGGGRVASGTSVLIVTVMRLPGSVWLRRD